MYGTTTYMVKQNIGALAPADRHVEGVVEMALDAIANRSAVVTRERWFRWHAALFATGHSGPVRINVGGWRDDVSGPMQVVSGPRGRQRVHFETPPAHRLESETARFLAWANSASDQPPLNAFPGLDAEKARQFNAMLDALPHAEKGSGH
jgi:Fic family protein